MLIVVNTAATLVAHARERRRLSRYALAKRAGVTPSTVTRIEEGEMDPTITMLDRLLAAAGQRLDIRSRPSQGPTLADLSTAVTDVPGDIGIDWTAFRAFLDGLYRRPGETERAIALPPHASASPTMRNLLAAIAEKLADDSGLPRPRWTHAIAPLRRPLLQPGTPRMQERAKANAAPQFRKRNLWLAESDFWRPRE